MTLGLASRWLTSKQVSLLASRPERLRHAPAKPAPAEGGEAKARPTEPPAPPGVVLPDEEPPPRTPGAILRVRLDLEHWLAFGMSERANVLVHTSNVFTPVKLDKGRNVAVYEDTEDLVVSGFTWDEAKKLLAGKAYLVHQPLGKGHVVAFAEDPCWRGYVEGTFLPLFDAVFLAPRR